jgi:hypothetical protein
MSGDPQRDLEHLRRLQAWRKRPEREVAVAPVVRRLLRERTRQAEQLGAVVEAFEELIPSELAAACSLAGMKAGVVSIEASSASVRFAVDRLLRSGTEAALRSRLAERGVTVSAIRVVAVGR